MKGLYDDVLTHDLLNTITVVQGVVDILSMDEKIRKRREFKVIRRNLEKLVAMIENAQRLGRLEDKKSLVVERGDLGVYIRNSMERVKPLAKKRKIKLLHKLNGGYPSELNPVIEEVFLNLLSNAVKYSPEGAKVVVGIESQDGDWLVMVKDNGEGIPDEYKDRVFKRFNRADKEGIKGAGLGLAIVRRIVDLHRGEVWVDDNPGGGSIFHVKLAKAA